MDQWEFGSGSDSVMHIVSWWRSRGGGEAHDGRRDFSGRGALVAPGGPILDISLISARPYTRAHDSLPSASSYTTPVDSYLP